jgi:renierapurpurin 18,18'-hydroxylase
MNMDDQATFENEQVSESNHIRPDIRKVNIDPDFWFPVYRASKLKVNKPVATSFAGDPIVLIRTKTDAVFALENRCAHRQVPLSAGVVQGETIRCGYHGWTYNQSGRCVNVPYLDKDKKLPTGVRSYPCKEEYGFIFIFPGDPQKADSVPMPDIPTWHRKDYKTRYLDREVKCHYSFMHENLMDMNHQFLHRKLMGSIRTVFLEKRKGHNWVECDYTFARKAGRQHIGEKLILRKNTKLDTTDMEEKDRDTMIIKTEYPYQTLSFRAGGSTEPELQLWNVYIPVDKEQRVNHTYGLMMFQRPETFPWLMDIFWPLIIWFTEGIFAEDRWIVELEQAAHDAQGSDWNQEIFPIIKDLRQVLIENGIKD